MLENKYNRIILPFFFLSEILIIVLLYMFLINNLNQDIDFIQLLVIISIWSIPSLYFSSYKVFRTHSIRIAIIPTTNNILLFAFLFILLIYTDFIPFLYIREFLGFLFSIIFVQYLFTFFRFILFHKYRLKGKNYKNILLISDSINQYKIDEIEKDGLHYGYKLKIFIDDLNNVEEKLEDIVLNNKIDLIFLHVGVDRISKIIANFCDQKGIRLKILLNFSDLTASKSGLDIIGGFPVMDVRKEPLLYLENRIIKRLVDIIMSTLSILFVLTWLPFIVKLAQIISYPGPLFFIQNRIGQDGKVFKLYKFRTMYFSDISHLAEKGHAKKTEQNDNRVPFFGRLLRSTNLDEYPQFLNVFIGSMSTVGPRPHMIGEDSVLEEKVSRYKVRRFVKPGITGWAAINGFRGGTDDMDLMLMRTNFDIWYLENWTIWMDFKIIIKTIWQMITFKVPKAY